jgi:hypothetical protein
MQNVSLLETGVAGWTDTVVVRYSATNSGLSSSNVFHLQGNAVTVKHEEVRVSCAMSLS